MTRSFFTETAKGWYWNMEKLYWKYAVKLYPMILVVNQYILLIYCCTFLNAECYDLRCLTIQESNSASALSDYYIDTDTDTAARAN